MIVNNTARPGRMPFVQFLILLPGIVLALASCGSDGSGGSGCTETTFKIVGADYAAGFPFSDGAFYVCNTSSLGGCTTTHPDNETITVKCPDDVFGNLDLCIGGLKALQAAAPGNILSGTGCDSSCGGKTATSTPLACKSCGYSWQITSGACQ